MFYSHSFRPVKFTGLNDGDLLFQLAYAYMTVFTFSNIDKKPSWCWDSQPSVGS